MNKFDMEKNEDNYCKNLAIKIFDDIADLTKDNQGVTRESYGKGEDKAIKYLENLANDLGLFIEVDECANVIFSINENKNSSYILVGSHMDSVPRGGNFDGLAGVVAGFVILAEIKHKNIKFNFPIKVIALRAEESAWFGPSFIGSKAIFGLLTKKDLSSMHRDKNLSLKEAMLSCGANVEKVQSSKIFLNKDKIKAFVELHIEQGPILIDKKWPAAIVTGIRGNIRYRKISCLGTAGHSGTIPRWLRKDSVFASTELISRMDDHWKTIEQHGGDLVLTSGIFHTDNLHHAMSRIPGELFFSFEARSQDPSTLLALEGLLKSECKTIEKERGVKFKFDDLIKSAPAELDKNIIDKLLKSAEKFGLNEAILPSGAGHDAAIFSAQGVPTGMIFVRNDNGSHNPEETMEIKDFIVGVSILKDFIKNF